MPSDYRGPYQVARRLAMARSGGICQLCGHRQAVECHHWAGTPLGRPVHEYGLRDLLGCRVLVVGLQPFAALTFARGHVGELLRRGNGAKFDEWSASFTVEVDEELIDRDRLDAWLDIAGRRVGVGDWRPEKSGFYGRFATDHIEAL